MLGSRVRSAVATGATLALTFATPAVGLAATRQSVPPLTVAFDYGSPNLQENFNPFAPNHLSGVNFMFEPLYVVNNLSGKRTPWLASGFRWASPTKLIFTMRSGIDWSDGKPLTSQDVAYTFNLLRRYPALDLNGLWSVLASVKAHGSTVVFTFSHPDVPYWYYIATTPIVPEHQWTHVKDPVKFTDPKPVVSGPYLLSQFTASAYTLRRNPQYWQKTRVKVPELRFLALTGNTTSDLLLSEGKLDWATVFTPGIQKTYVARNPKYYHYWFPAGPAQVLYVNLKRYPFNLLGFRQALAYAINKRQIVSQGEYGYPQPANQAILPPAIQRHWLDPSLAKRYQYPYNPAKALRILDSLGFRLKGGHLMTPQGKPLSLVIEAPAAYTDMVQDEEIIARDLARLGIKVRVFTTSVSTDSNDLYTGHYDMGIWFTNLYPNPWLTYNQLLNSKESAPIGQVTTDNLERWENGETDQLLNAFAHTTNSAAQHRLMNRIEAILFTKLPVISLFYGPTWYEYQTNHYVGWPTPQNPYADPGNNYPSTLLMAIHLRPRP